MARTGLYRADLTQHIAWDAREVGELRNLVVWPIWNANTDEVQANPALRPLWTPEAAGVGRPAVVFNGPGHGSAGTDFLDGRSGAASQWFAATTWSCAMAFRFHSSATDSTTPANNDAILSNNGGNFGIYARSSGLVGCYQYDGAYKKVELAYRFEDLVVAVVFKDATTLAMELSSQKGGMASGSVACGNLDNTQPGPRIGRASTTSFYAKADLCEAQLFSHTLTSAERNAVRLEMWNRWFQRPHRLAPPRRLAHSR